MAADEEDSSERTQSNLGDGQEVRWVQRAEQRPERKVLVRSRSSRPVEAPRHRLRAYRCVSSLSQPGQGGIHRDEERVGLRDFGADGERDAFSGLGNREVEDGVHMERMRSDILVIASPGDSKQVVKEVLRRSWRQRMYAGVFEKLT